MLRTLRRKILRALTKLFSEETARRVARFFSRKFIEQVRTKATDDLLDLLLRSMDIAFCLDRRYRRDHLEGLRAQYVFATRDGKVGATVRFDEGDMKFDEKPADDFTVRVRFSNPEALRRFLFAEKQDVLDSLLRNEVELDGNLNYIYKFGFMARDLERRLGMLN